MTLSRLGFRALIALIVIVCLAPFVWTIITSLKDERNIYAVPITYLPEPPTLENYALVLRLSRFTRSLLNSFIIASSTMLISLGVGTLCAYAIARLEFPLKRLILGLILTISMFPGIVIVAPLFRQFREWGL